MIPTTILSNFETIYARDKGEWLANFSEQLALEKARAAVNGALNGSRASLALISIAKSAITNRGKSIALTFVERIPVHQRYLLDVDAVAEAVELCMSKLRILHSDVRQRLSHEVAMMVGDFDKFSTEELTRNQIEIEEIIAPIPMNEPSVPANITVHNHGHGTVVVGNRNATTITQSLAQNGPELRDALSKLSDQLANLNVGEELQEQLDELRELVVQTSEEVAESRPNKLKIAGFLAAISSAIGLFADVGPAYESIKAIAALSGYKLD